ncbi:MAG: hypothetical protein U9Q69_04410 [Nanoarchaeota archaeon]|nr:hypothetical protein [Nanoarchaeota archaeon]
MSWYSVVMDFINGLLPNFKPSFKTRDIKLKFSFLSGNKLLEVNNYNTLLIDSRHTNPQQLSLIKKFCKARLKENKLFFDTKTTNLIEDIKKEKKQNIKGEKIIAYLKNKINSQDLNALKVAVYIQIKFEKGEDISKYKNELRFKHGERGNMISKLYSAGYFEKIIVPLFESSSDLETIKKDFDKLIQEFPLAFFVNKYMLQEKLNGELINKIIRNKKYGINILNIHGIGKKNIEKIKKSIKFIEKKKKIRISNIEEKAGIILVSIEII